MIQKLPQLKEVLSLNSINTQDAIEYINSYIEKHSCEHMSIDLSFMNVIDACHVTTLCSTKHFSKYPQGKINWKLSSSLVKDLIKDLDLGNCEYTL